MHNEMNHVHKQTTAGKRLQETEGDPDALESTAEGAIRIVYPD